MNLSAIILGIIMLIAGFGILIFGLLEWMIISIIIILGGLFLISISTKKRW